MFRNFRSSLEPYFYLRKEKIPVYLPILEPCEQFSKCSFSLGVCLLDSGYTQNVQCPLTGKMHCLNVLKSFFFFLAIHIFFEQNICLVLLKIELHKSKKGKKWKILLTKIEILTLSSYYYLWKFTLWKFSLGRI